MHNMIVNQIITVIKVSNHNRHKDMHKKPTITILPAKKITSKRENIHQRAPQSWVAPHG